MAKAPTDIIPTTDAAGLVAEVARLATQHQMGEVISVRLSEDLDAPGLPRAIPALRRPDGNIAGLDSLFQPWRLKPARVTGRALVQDLDSLIEMINWHKVSHSLIVVDRGKRPVTAQRAEGGSAALPKPSITAIIDYHPASLGDDTSVPEWCQHRIHYPYPLSDRFAEWLLGDDKMMGQSEFALLLEDRIVDLVSPADTERATYEPRLETRIATPADLMTLARNLEIYETAKVKQGVRLQSGERQMVFESEHVDAAGGAVKIPGLFMIELPLFIGGETVRMPVRLRYRLANNKVVWGYQMWRVEDFLIERLTDDVATLREATGLTVVYGDEGTITQR